MKRIIFILLCMSFFIFSEGFEKFKFKENAVFPRTEIFSYSMLGNVKIDPLIGLELTDNIYLSSTGELRIDLYAFAGRKLNKKIKILSDGNYSYIAGNKLIVENGKKTEETEINLNHMKYRNMKVERKNSKLEVSIFPIVYETIEKVDENTYKLSSYMKKGFTAKKSNDETIEIYYGDKLENIIKLENNVLNVYDKAGKLEASISETENSMKITESKITREIKVTDQSLEVFESNKKKSVASYTIKVM